MQITRSLTVEKSTGNYEKVVITLDEEDLARTLMEQIPEVLPSQLTTSEAFQILELEAQTYLLSVSIIRFGCLDRDEGSDQLKRAKVSRLNLLEDIKLRVLRVKSESYDATSHANRLP